MHEETKEITDIILQKAEEARKQTGTVSKPEFTGPVRWPVACTVGPGLEGAIACESEVGYVDGSHGRLIYRGYDIFDLCAYSSFEEVSYLLLYGELPTASRLKSFEKQLKDYRRMPMTLRRMMTFPIEEMNPMDALRLGTTLMRHEFTYAVKFTQRPDVASAISADEDSIPMETMPRGEPRAIYSFRRRAPRTPRKPREKLEPAAGIGSCVHLLSGAATIAAAVARLRQGDMPVDPDPDLGYAANYLYMITGRRPTPVEERIMDVALILHADHGMNASTFAAMVVASTLSDFYLSVGAGIAALNGPLHGGANEQVLRTLEEIGSVRHVNRWYRAARASKRRIVGFGHRVYKTYDPRARVLEPLADYLAAKRRRTARMLRIARALESRVVADLGTERGIYPNVDFYSGLVYLSMGIPTELFTATFAVSRVSGWTARMLEYLENNRIFRPRAIYVGPLKKRYRPMGKRR
jgi:citrate synthase